MDDLQVLFSLAIAYGVLTLASIALFNVASIRLFDVQKTGEDDDPKTTSKCVYEFTYCGNSTGRLKQIVKHFPLIIGLSGAMVAASWAALCVAFALQTGEGDGGSLGIVAMVTLAVYLSSLVAFTTVVSAKLHTVIQDVKLTLGNPLKKQV